MSYFKYFQDCLLYSFLSICDFSAMYYCYVVAVVESKRSSRHMYKREKTETRITICGVASVHETAKNCL